MGWSKQQVKGFAKQFRTDIGADGWRFMTRETRRAFIAAKVLQIVLGQDAEVVHVEGVRDLMNAMERELGVNTEVEEPA